jgi:hypothetical protein
VEDSTTPGDEGVEEIIEDLRAEHVTIAQGGAGRIEAGVVEITQGGAQTIEAENVSLSQAGAFTIESTTADVNMSGVGFLTTDTVTLRSGGAGVVIADTVKAETGSVIGVLFAGTIEGDPNVRVDFRAAAAAGVGFAVALFVLRRVFRRR